MLLLTLLPFAGWATDVVKVGGYEFTVSSKLVELGGVFEITAVSDATETATIDETGDIYDTKGQVVNELTQVGSYFQQVTVTRVVSDETKTESVFVPFMVVKSNGVFDTENIWNSSTWNTSVEGGILQKYFSFDWAENLDQIGGVHNWKSIITNVSHPQRSLMFPQINYQVKGLEEGEKYAVYATYKKRVLVNNPDPAAEPAEPQYVTEGTYTEWDATTGKPALYGNNSFWMLSIPALYKGNCPYAAGSEPDDPDFFDANYTLTYNTAQDETVAPNGDALVFDGQEPATISDAVKHDFAWEYVNLYLAPQEAPFKMTATLTNPVQTYTNSELNPGLVVYVGTTEVGPKGEADGYTVTWYQDGVEVDKLINAGSYIGIVTYKENVAIVEFTITRAADKVVIEPAYVEKVYGTIEDPDPDFEFTGALFEGDNLAEEIKPFLVLKRSSEDPVATREDVGDHKYYIDFTDEYRAGKCNYEIKIIDNHSILKITPAPLSIRVTDATATKEYKKADPVFAYANDDAMKNQLKFNDAEKAFGTPGAADVITSITREKAGTTEGEVVSAEGYKFTATSKNYKVTVTNNFTITPATDLSGLKVKFAKEPNSTVYLDGAAYTYTGAAQEPAFKVIDTDYELVAGTDYVTEGEGEPVYSNNTDVTTAAKVTVTLKGNYTGTVEGIFTIEKAELTVAATSYTVEPDAYGYEITGWVTGETAANQKERNTTGDNAVTYFNAPESGVVTKGNEIESGVFELVVNTSGFEAKNYKFKAQNGLLALNGTEVITVKPKAFYKQYDGEDVTPEELDVVVYDESGTNEAEGFNKKKLELANGPIYEIAKKGTGRKHTSRRGANDATGANEGFYDITLRGPSVIQGYTINWVGLEEGCEIDYRSIVLKADDKTKVYGAAVPTLTAQVVPAEEREIEGETVIVGGLIGDDTEQSIGLVNNGPNNTGYYVSLSSPYSWNWNNNSWNINGEHVTVYELNDDETVKTDTRYPISVNIRNTNGIFGNYQVTGENGKLAVTKASVLIAAADATKQFGTADPNFTITVTPANDGTPASVATVANMNTFWKIDRTDKDAANGAGETVGAHKTLKLTLTDAGKNAENFNIEASTENGTLTITAAELMVKAHGQWINYGEEINLYDVEITKPSGDGTKVLKWNKVTTDASGQPIPLNDTQTAENNAIKALGHLEVLEGKMEIGTNYDAFKFVVDDANYVIAPDKQEGQQTIHGFTNNTLLVYPLTVIPLDKDMLAEILTNKALTPKTLTKVLQDHQGCTVDVILPRRAMKANDWYAWVLPFEVKQRDIFTVDKWGYGAMEPLDVEKTTDKSVAFKLTVQPIPANTPFLVKVDQDIVATRVLGTPETTVAMDEIVMEDVVIGELNYLEENPASGSETTVQFVGLYDEKKGFDETTRILRRVPNASAPMEFWPGGANSANITLPRTYAYLQFPDATSAKEARIYIQEPDGTYTAINSVNADGTVNGESIYNLSGQRVNKAQKGIYIKDGKKVLVK